MAKTAKWISNQIRLNKKTVTSLEKKLKSATAKQSKLEKDLTTAKKREADAAKAKAAKAKAKAKSKPKKKAKGKAKSKAKAKGRKK